MALSAARATRTPRILRRQELIEAAVATIAEEGLSGTTLAKVAARAGLTAAAVSFHFSSKETLLLETLGYVSTELENAIRDAVQAVPDSDPGAGLLAVIKVMLDPRFSDTNRLSVWYAFVAESQARSGYREICGESDRVFDDTVTGLCQRLFAGQPESRVDPQAIANGLVGLLENEWQSLLLADGKADRKAARRRCLAYLASVSPWRFEMPSKGLTEVEPAKARANRPDTAPSALQETLPSWIYQSEQFAAQEREHIFMSAWLTVCHVNDVKETGDYATFEMLDERAFVIRGQDGELRAFHNVCRHRAHALVSGSGGSCARAITCPYHSWTYDFDGADAWVHPPRTPCSSTDGRRNGSMDGSRRG